MRHNAVCTAYTAYTADTTHTAYPVDFGCAATLAWFCRTGRAFYVRAGVPLPPIRNLTLAGGGEVSYWATSH